MEPCSCVSGLSILLESDVCVNTPSDVTTEVPLHFFMLAVHLIQEHAFVWKGQCGENVSFSQDLYAVQFMEK
jgi:hypothetical protein